MTTTFRSLEKSGVLKRADARKAELKDLHEEPDFNLRDKAAVYEDGTTFESRINDLAEYIAAGGIYPPLEVRIRPEGGFWIVEGHRRTLALNILAAAGRLPADPKDGKHWINIVPFEGNDADRLARIFTSQENQKLTATEKAAGFARFKAFGFSNADIAKHLKCSVVTVNNMMTLAGANTDVQQLVKEGKVSSSAAIATVKKHGEQAGAVIAKAVASGVKPKVVRATVEGFAAWIKDTERAGVDVEAEDWALYVESWLTGYKDSLK